MLVTPASGKYWRMKYRFHDKEKVLALGVYPEVSLARAREKRFDARVLLSEKKDPNVAKKEQLLKERVQAGNTFETLTREWLALQKNKWTERHADRVLASLEANIFPALGQRPVAEITPIELLEVLKVIEKRGALDMAGRVLQRCNSVFQFAIESQRAEINPAGALPGALQTPVRKNNVALSAKDLPKFLTKLEQFGGHPITKLAIQLLMLTFVRTGELRAAEWDEFDISGKQWCIPADRMKMGVEHLVPLSDQAIERQLAHGERDKVRAAYNKAKYLDTRKEMMQAWADYLDRARGGKAASPSIQAY